jgi:DNA-binding NarL/FixJ family response regulator
MTKQPSTRIVIADDHPLFRGALRQAVSHALEGADVSEVGSLESLTEALSQGADADLVLLDLTMPGVQGFSGLLFLRADHPEVPVIVVSANDEPTVIRRCIEFGALGFLPKTADVEQMGEAIRAVLAGSVWTTWCAGSRR